MEYLNDVNAVVHSTLLMVQWFTYQRTDYVFGYTRSLTRVCIKLFSFMQDRFLYNLCLYLSH